MTEVAIAPVFDLEALLAPIAGDSPAGESLRHDHVWDEIRRLREEDDPALPQGVWQRELKRADWNGVIDVASEALRTRSKDLQLAAWLTEAWLNRHRFPGLRAGLQLITALCREYWDSVHPQIENGDVSARMAAVTWLADKLPLPVKRISISAPSGEDEQAYTWLDSELALYHENRAKARPNAPPETGVVTHPKFLVSVSMTPASWYATLAEELSGAIAAVDELDDTLVALAGEADAPSLSPLREPLAAIHQFVSRVLAERVQSGELASWAVGAESAPPFEGRDLDAPRPGAPILSRAEAFQRLRESAEYLMRTEPHSPVPYLVRRAVSWEHMSLAELLEELLSRGSDLATLYQLLGIRR
ncbi:MAG TPA: type VI secretion system protein TssA [Thermoanaerobaculia bacterium]|nr:type VI secretion system protein TssA [Thermoanaerobaculia bacterium]